MITSIDAKIRSSWQVPDYEVLYWQGKQQNFCVVNSNIIKLKSISK